MIILRASIPVSIEIKKNISSECGNIEADPTQLYQIVMNLCTNAFHAMEEDGGILSIELQIADTVPIELKDKNIIEQTFIKLSVSDTGTGIAPDIIDKIFDPFFTTKEVGEGTGMGLSIIYGIIKEYSGTINVKSTPEKETVFDIYIPQSKQKPTSSLLNKTIISKGVEQILFIDNEEFIVDMNKEMLENLGYKVITSHKSTEALHTFQKEPDKFDLIITDQTMPEMTGLELSIQVLKIRPDIPIILCTGFSNIINEENAKAYGIKGFLNKPVAMTKLTKLIRELLD